MIYKIERLAVYDGPGIRTVIFLKGCPLSCLWCASPESQKMKPEIEFRPEKCTHCGACADVCCSGAIEKTGDKQGVFTRSRCANNGDCADACLFNARKIIGQKMSVTQVVQELEKDTVFYHRSRGGVTLSGGDPVFQPQFSTAILKQAVEMGFHAAIETCAWSKWESFALILEHLDLAYVDLKHMNAESHKKLTGKGNEVILENIRQMDAQFPHLDLVLRVPVIPGLNDDEHNMIETAKFARDLKTLKRLELLPYHRYGVAVYPAVGRDYSLPGTLPPTLGQVEKLKETMQAHGITVQIGG